MKNEILYQRGVDKFSKLIQSTNGIQTLSAILQFIIGFNKFRLSSLEFLTRGKTVNIILEAVRLVAPTRTM